MSNEQSLERRITALGFSSPRISPAQIDLLAKSLSFHTYVIPGTSTTVAAAIDVTGSVVALATSENDCSNSFGEVLARDTAVSKVKTMAVEELWKFERYRLSKNIHQASKVGLIAGLEVYAHEDLRDDLLFVGDVATGFCVASINANASSINESASSMTAKCAP
ncbi:hypothetical protein [Pseudomonas sp. RT6P73]